MSENYIVINGKSVELTAEQLEKLGIKPEMNKYKEMFERSDDKEPYFFINDVGEIVYHSDIWNGTPAARYACGNLCKDKDIMEQRALHETLNRLLWRASVIAGELDNKWDGIHFHYYIYYIISENMYTVDRRAGNTTFGTVYFPTEESAKDAIETIIKPFMEEHPDFVW